MTDNTTNREQNSHIIKLLDKILVRLYLIEKAVGTDSDDISF